MVEHYAQSRTRFWLLVCASAVPLAVIAFYLFCQSDVRSHILAVTFAFSTVVMSSCVGYLQPTRLVQRVLGSLVQLLITTILLALILYFVDLSTKPRLADEIVACVLLLFWNKMALWWAFTFLVGLTIGGRLPHPISIETIAAYAANYKTLIEVGALVAGMTLTVSNILTR